MRRRAVPTWLALGLAASCALPELRVDPDLDPDTSSGGGGASGSAGADNGGSTSGATTGGKGGASGADAGKGGAGKGGAATGGAATGGTSGAATGGKAGASTCEDSGLTTCGDVCASLDSDPLRCGSCTHRCAATYGCTNGVCACPPDTEECSGTCIDTSSDRLNCGACGTECASSEWCSDSSCRRLTCPTTVAHAALPLLDDFEDGDSIIAQVDGRLGYWWTYSSGEASCALSPVPNVPFAPVAGGPAPSRYALHVTAQGCSFGGLGCDLNNPMGRQCPIDATAFTGIRFHYLSPSTPIRIQIGTPETIPTEFGGDCTANCNDFYGFVVPAATAWAVGSARFSDFEQSDGNMSLMASALMSLQFTSSTSGSFDFWIDQIEFY